MNKQNKQKNLNLIWNRSQPLSSNLVWTVKWTDAGLEYVVNQKVQPGGTEVGHKPKMWFSISYPY